MIYQTDNRKVRIQKREWSMQKLLEIERARKVDSLKISHEGKWHLTSARCGGPAVTCLQKAYLLGPSLWKERRQDWVNHRNLPVTQQFY